MPHDLANALCAAAAALAAGADPGGCRRALVAFRGLPHRVELVGEANGVRFYDDSKATTPGAVLAALDGFPSAVLIAGGRNKGLDLSVLRTRPPTCAAVVAIGEAARRGRRRPSPGLCRWWGAVDGRRRGGGGCDGPARVTPWCCRRRAPRSTGTAPTRGRGDDFARCVRALPGFGRPHR